MLFLKFFHVLFIFIWIGMLLAITRLMGYLSKESSEVQKRLSYLCRRMYFFIDFPSMVIAVTCGIVLLCLKDINWKEGWIHMKLTFAFFLVLTDLWTGKEVLRLSKAPKGGIRYKVLHALAGLLLVGVLVSIYIIKAKMTAQN